MKKRKVLKWIGGIRSSILSEIHNDYETTYSRLTNVTVALENCCDLQKLRQIMDVGFIEHRKVYHKNKEVWYSSLLVYLDLLP